MSNARHINARQKSLAEKIDMETRRKLAQGLQECRNEQACFMRVIRRLNLTYDQGMGIRIIHGL